MKATLEQVQAVPCPEWTKTWHPMPYNFVDFTIKDTCKILNLTIIDESYELWSDNNCMFAAIILEPIYGISKVIYYRNSLNKWLSFGLNAGTRDNICLNMEMPGDFLEFQRHTTLMNDESLSAMIHSGVEAISEHLGKFIARHLAMDDIQMLPMEIKSLGYDALNQKIISSRNFPRFNKMLFEDDNRYSPIRLSGFHGVCTELLKDLPMNAYFHQKQKALNDLIEERFGGRLPSLPDWSEINEN